MNTVRTVLRMGLEHKCGMRDIGRALNISHSTVIEYMSAAKKAHFDIDKMDNLTDPELRALIKPPLAQGTTSSDRPVPDCAYLHQELQKKHVTLALLWHEYKERHGEKGYQLSQFCKIYRLWLRKQPISMRQHHSPGEKMFVDYAGTTIPIKNLITGSITKAQVFIAVLGKSNYTYAEATSDQSLRNWTASHVRAFEFFGGSTQYVVPDNLRSGVTKSCRYEPVINQTYQSLAEHYHTGIVPARVSRPKDKAKVEAGVLIASRWIIAALRNRTFYSLEELNEAIAVLLEKLNRKQMHKIKKSRFDVFNEEEKITLAPLPQEQFVFAEWKQAKANIDYHVECDQHYYSVPYKLRNEQLTIRYTSTTVELFHQARKIATHLRSFVKHDHTTIKDHMPPSHQAVLEWSPSRMIRWAERIGVETKNVIETILNRREYPEHGYRSCLGILRLAKEYTDARLENACRRASATGAYSRKSIRSILANGLDMVVTEEPAQPYAIAHSNVRGGAYFSNPKELYGT
jgi:transposase